MKGNILILPFAMFIALVAMNANANAAATPNTDCSHQRMLDADNDGIPNCDDADYAPPLDGTGYKFGKTQATIVPNGLTFRFTWNLGVPFMFGLWVPNVGEPAAPGYGPGDGTGNDGDGPADGTGYGPGPLHKK